VAAAGISKSVNSSRYSQDFRRSMDLNDSIIQQLNKIRKEQLGWYKIYFSIGIICSNVQVSLGNLARYCKELHEADVSVTPPAAVNSILLQRVKWHSWTNKTAQNYKDAKTVLFLTMLSQILATTQIKSKGSQNDHWDIHSGAKNPRITAAAASSALSA